MLLNNASNALLLEDTGSICIIGFIVIATFSIDSNRRKYWQSGGARLAQQRTPPRRDGLIADALLGQSHLSWMRSSPQRLSVPGGGYVWIICKNRRIINSRDAFEHARCSSVC